MLKQNPECILTVTIFSGIGLPPPAVRSRSKGDNSLSRRNRTTPKKAPPSCSEHSVGPNSSISSVPGNPSSLSRSIYLEENESMSSENPSASQSLPSAGCLFTQTTREESDQSSRVERRYMSQTQTGPNTQTICKFFVLSQIG